MLRIRRLFYDIFYFINSKTFNYFDFHFFLFFFVIGQVGVMPSVFVEDFRQISTFESLDQLDAAPIIFRIPHAGNKTQVSNTFFYTRYLADREWFV